MSNALQGNESPNKLWRRWLDGFLFFCYKEIYLEIVVASGEKSQGAGKRFERAFTFYCLPFRSFEVL